MSNIKVLIYVESRYKVNRKRVKKAIGDILVENSMKSPVEVSIAVVGDRKMKRLNLKYRKLDKTTNVLSFPLNEDFHPHLNPLPSRERMGLFPSPPVGEGQGEGGIARLGDIVLSYPQVIHESARDEMLVDEKIDQLVKHSMLHLLGIHHG